IEIYADLRKQRKNAQVPDNFEVLLYYPNMKATLKASALVKAKGPTYSVHGTKGSFVKYGIDSQEEMLKSGLKPNGNWGWGQESQEIWGKLDILDRKSTRLNSSHVKISYAVFCLKKKTRIQQRRV